MTTTSSKATVTDTKRLATLKHLASGKGLDVVATIVGLPKETVLDIGSRHGYPDTEKLAWAADIVEKKIHDGATDLPAGRPLPKTTGAAPTSPAAAPVPHPAHAPEPLTRPDEIRVLLNTAKAHPSKRIQAQANRVFDAVDRLRELLREDEEKHAERRKADAAKAAARAEVERLEAQLTAAKAKLRGKPAAAKKSHPLTKGEHPCRNEGCDKVYDTPQGRSLHERMKCEHRPAAEAS